MPKELAEMLLAFLPVAAAAVAGSLATRPGLSTWYPRLQKPSFNPPNAVFAPVWSLLYLLMAYAFYRVLKTDISWTSETVLVFLLQLFLNSSWSWVFFGIRCILCALFLIEILLLFIGISMVLFLKVDLTSGVLLIPYFIWVSFANILNFQIWKLNRSCL